MLDLAATEAFEEAVVALDWVLAHGIDEGLGSGQVLDEWDTGSRPAPDRGRARPFADPPSGSAGESLSRVLIAEARLPAPDAAAAVLRPARPHRYVDFWWPDFGLIGEFDGLKKYREATSSPAGRPVRS